MTWTILSEQLYSSNFSIKVQIWVQINLSHVIRTLKICSHKIEQKSEIDKTCFLMTMSFIYIFLKKQAKNNNMNKWSSNGRFWHGNINVIKETTSVVIHNRKSFSFGVKYLKKKCTYPIYTYICRVWDQKKNDIYIILTNSCITQLLIKSILNYFILLQSIRKWKALFKLSLNAMGTYKEYSTGHL